MRMRASWLGSLRPTGYKVAARVPRAPTASSPRTCHPDHNQRAAVLGAVKAGLETTERAARPERRPTLTAPARAGLQHVWVGAEKRDSRSNKETDQESKKGRKIAALKPLDNKSPIQGRKAGRSACAGADQTRARDQPQDRQSARPHHPGNAVGHRRRGDRIAVPRGHIGIGCCDAHSAAGQGHVWTAPAVQEESDI